MNYNIKRDDSIDPYQLHDLRLSLSWKSSLDKCRDEVKKSYSNFSYKSDGILTGYLNSISNGVTDALLNNLIVRQDHQKKGLGKALIKKAVNELSKDGITFFNILFEEDLVLFYKKCGFNIIKGGVIDLNKI